MIPISHGLRAASGAASGAAGTSDLLFIQAKWALAAGGKVQQGPEPRTPGFSYLSSAPEALWTTGPYDVGARELLASVFWQQNQPQHGLVGSLPLGSRA